MHMVVKQNIHQSALQLSTETSVCEEIGGADLPVSSAFFKLTVISHLDSTQLFCWIVCLHASVRTTS